MVYLSLTLACVLFAIAGVHTSPTGGRHKHPSKPIDDCEDGPVDIDPPATTLSTPNAIGKHDGYYYMWQRDAAADATFTNGPGGQYSVEWRGGDGEFLGGKGWNPGGPRTVSYSGEYRPLGASFLGLYGWTTNPLVEYFIIENSGAFWNPTSGAKRKGRIFTDGSLYDISVNTQTNKPSIEGNETFQQYFSFRNNERVGGNITTSSHFAAWEELGMELGTHNVMILATDGYYSKGSAKITVHTPP